MEEQRSEHIYVDCITQSSSTIAENLYAIAFTLTEKQNDSETSAQFIEYIVVENEEYKLLIGGVLECQNYEGYETEYFSIQGLTMYRTVQEIQFTYTFNNKTSNGISLGWVNPATVILTTDAENHYTYSFEHTTKILAYSSEDIMINFVNAGEIPTELLLQEIYTLDNNGLPTNSWGDSINSWSITLTK